MDEREFDDFYAASFQRITGQVYAMIGNRDEAQECVQEAFVRAWAHRKKLDKAEHPEAWVRTAAYRLAVSRWRRTTRGRRPADRAVSLATEAAAPSENHVALVAALKQLPEAQRQALVLHHIADLPVQEVAREVGVPEGTIKARLSRGRTALAALLADDVPGGFSRGIGTEGASHA
jgi:RNA polymerase sigma-70 factor (ECF subfamily)